MYNGLYFYNQQPMTKKQEQELYNFLSIGCGERCRELSKQLNLTLNKSKEIKIFRRKVSKIMHSIGLDKGFIGKLTRILEKSGLSLQQQRTIVKHIKRLLLDFQRGVHNNLDLRGLNLMQLPLSLRRFIIALIVLKAEIVNLHRLRMEDLDKLRQINNMPKISIEDRNIGLNEMPRDLDNHEHYATGLSLTRGRHDGMNYFDVFCKDSNRDIKYDNKTTKRDRNRENNKQKNTKKYYNEEKKFNDKETTINANDFYKTNQRENYFY